MSRKVKVVAVDNASEPQAPEPEVAVSEVAAPEVAAPEPEVALPEPEVVENSSSDKPEPVAIEAPKETKAKKKDEKMTCPVCNKTMLSKHTSTHIKLYADLKSQSPKSHSLNLRRKQSQKQRRFLMLASMISKR